MGTSNVALGVVIGGAVGATFGKALSDSSAKIDAFKQKAETARGFHNMIGDTIRLRGEMDKLSDKSGQAFSTLLRAHEANIAKLRQHGFAVDALDKDYVRLGRTLKGLELGATGRVKIGAGIEQGKEALRMGTAVTAAVAAPTMISANYQSIIRDIAIKGGIARTDKETAMSESIRKDAHDSGIDRNELAQAVNTLVAGGMSVDDAVARARAMARFSVGQNADSTDTAKLVLALKQAGINDPAALERALGKIAVAGDLGSFEAKDMAKHFAVLMPQMTAFGMAGERATVELANMLQTQMRTTNSTDEAANNLRNLLTKITSEDTKKKFGDNGFNLEGSMQAAIAKGYDPVSAFLLLVQEAMKKTDPEKAKQLAALQAKIAEAQDPAAAQKMLDGYLEMAGLAEYISDREAKQGALAVLQNQKLHKENLKLIQSTDGQAKIEKDLADRRAASANKWKEVGRSVDEALARIGDAIRPATDALADGLKVAADGIAYVSKEAPILARGIFGIGAAFAATLSLLAAKKVVGGAWDVAKGAFLARGANKIPGLSTVAGKGKGAASKVMDVIGAATGAGAQPVFVTNWPGGGFDIPGKSTGKSGPLSPKDKLGRATHIGRATTVAEAAGGAAAAGKTGMIARIGAAITGVAGAGRTVLAAPTLGAAVASGAGSVAMAGGMVAAAGAAGYGIGTLINAGIDKAISAATGKETSLGSWLYDKLHPESPAPTAAGAGRPADAGKAGAAAPVTFAPSLAITVQGDVKDPRDLAQTLMPHLRRLFDQMQAQNARTMLHDAPHV